MLIAGFDPSQKTGWAFYDPDADLSAMRCGTLKATGTDFEDKAASLAMGLVALLKQNRDPRTQKIILPDFAVIERAPRQQYSQGGKKPKFMGEAVEDAEEGGSVPGLSGTLSTNQMTGALCAILGAYHIPFETIMPVTWRKAAYGFGTHRGWKRPDWKRQAREQCARAKIIATNDDSAEACWIAFAGKGCQSFRMLDRARAA